MRIVGQLVMSQISGCSGFPSPSLPVVVSNSAQNSPFRWSTGANEVLLCGKKHRLTNMSFQQHIFFTAAH